MWYAGSQFPDQGLNLCPLQWKRRVLTTGPPGKSREELQEVQGAKDLFGCYLQAWKRGSKSQRSSPLGADFITWLQTSARLDQEDQAKTVLKPREELSNYKGSETWDGAVKARCGGTGQNGLSFSENIFGVLKIRIAFS